MKGNNKGNYIIKDTFFYKAKQEGYRARSAYKLLEIQNKFNLIKPNLSVIDIGAAPGSFLQILQKIIGEKNIIIGVDSKPIKPFNFQNIKTIVCDIFDYEKLNQELKKILPENHFFDLITSDIAQNTTGIFDIDQFNSVELNIAICKFSDVYLKKGGNMILKVFIGQDFQSLNKEIKKRFKTVKTYKPTVCRKSSRETYIICLSKN